MPETVEKEEVKTEVRILSPELYMINERLNDLKDLILDNKSEIKAIRSEMKELGEKTHAEIKTNNHWSIGLLIGMLVGFIGIIITFIISFKTLLS